MRLADIERRVSSMEELLRIVGALRAMASMRVQEAQRALAPVRAYGATLEHAVREAIALAADPARAADRSPMAGEPGSRARSGRRVIIVCTSEHGFVGGFNERLLAAAEADLGAGDAMWIIGTRGAAAAVERGHRAEWRHPMATRLGGLPEVVRRLEGELDPRIAAAEITRVEVIFGRDARSGGAAVERRRLFPLELADREPPAQASGPRPALPPLHTLTPGRLLERLAAQYVLARLTEAVTESLASENGARFAAMESAHDNVSRRLDQLRLDASRARQEEVTAELLELVTGEQASQR